MFGPSGDVRGGSQFFEQSPFRSTFFVVDTVLLGFALLIGGLELFRHWAQVPSITAMLVIAVLAGVVMLWTAGIRTHGRVHALYRSGDIRGVPSESPLDVAIRAASGMLHLALFYSCLFVIVLMAQFDKLLRYR